MPQKKIFYVKEKNKSMTYYINKFLFTKRFFIAWLLVTTIIRHFLLLLADACKL